MLAARRRDPAGLRGMHQPRYQYIFRPKCELSVRYPPFCWGTGTFRLRTLPFFTQTTYRVRNSGLVSTLGIPLSSAGAVRWTPKCYVQGNPVSTPSSQLHQFCLPISILSRYPYANQSQKTVIQSSSSAFFCPLVKMPARASYACKNTIQDFVAPTMLTCHPILSPN